jgi:hypothetical protein
MTVLVESSEQLSFPLQLLEAPVAFALLITDNKAAINKLFFI